MRKSQAIEILEDTKKYAEPDVREALDVATKAIKDDAIERHIIMEDILDQFVTRLTDDCTYLYDDEGNVTDMQIPIKLWYDTIDNID